MTVTNIGKMTTAINPPVFLLINEQGYEYEMSSRGIAGGGPADNLIEKLTVDRLSPLMPVKGKVVFDVPMGNYLMIVSRGEKGDRGIRYRGQDLFSYRLRSLTASENRKSYNPPSDLVPDEATAIKIAEAVWLPIYGEEVFKSRPFKATLRDGVWLVTGTLAKGALGGTPLAEISSKDGKLLRVTHEQ